MAQIVPHTLRSSRLGDFWLRAISPLSWPLGLRRTFLITFPLSFPFYLLVLVILLALMLMRAIIEPLAKFWSAPPEKLRSESYYSYERRQKRKRRLDQEPENELPLDD